MFKYLFKEIFFDLLTFKEFVQSYLIKQQVKNNKSMNFMNKDFDHELNSIKGV